MFFFFQFIFELASNTSASGNADACATCKHLWKDIEKFRPSVKVFEKVFHGICKVLKLKNCKAVAKESAPKMMNGILKAYSTSCHDAGLCDGSEVSDETIESFELNDSLETNEENFEISENLSKISNIFLSLDKNEPIICKSCLYYVNAIINLLKSQKGLIDIVLSTICSALGPSARKECNLIFEQVYNTIEKASPKDVCTLITLCPISESIEYDESEESAEILSESLNIDEGN